MRQLDAVVSYTNFAALITYGVCYESRKTERRKSLVKKSIERERARERERERGFDIISTTITSEKE